MKSIRYHRYSTFSANSFTPCRVRSCFKNDAPKPTIRNQWTTMYTRHTDTASYPIATNSPRPGPIYISLKSIASTKKKKKTNSPGPVGYSGWCIIILVQIHGSPNLATSGGHLVPRFTNIPFSPAACFHLPSAWFATKSREIIPDNADPRDSSLPLFCLRVTPRRSSLKD